MRLSDSVVKVGVEGDVGEGESDQNGKNVALLADLVGAEVPLNGEGPNGGDVEDHEHQTEGEVPRPILLKQIELLLLFVHPLPLPLLAEHILGFISYRIVFSIEIL